MYHLQTPGISRVPSASNFSNHDVAQSSSILSRMPSGANFGLGQYGAGDALNFGFVAPTSYLSRRPSATVQAGASPYSPQPHDAGWHGGFHATMQGLNQSFAPMQTPVPPPDIIRTKSMVDALDFVQSLNDRLQSLSAQPVGVESLI
jgi:hypothetical protein